MALIEGRRVLAKINVEAVSCPCGYLESQPDMKAQMATVTLTAYLDDTKEVGGTCRGCGKKFLKHGVYTIDLADPTHAGYIPFDMLHLDEGGAA